MDRLDDETLLSRLPRRQDDEPANLRQDLLDEVRDYLQSAWEAEQRRTSDPQEAWRIVLTRFGDPAKLVRKLWFDALKEQIMSRRLVLAAFGVVAVMFVAFAAINLRMLSALETTLAGAQKTNALLVEKLEALQAAAKATDDASMTWRHLRLHLVAEDKSPVSGKATLYGNPFGSASSGIPHGQETVVRDFGADGQVDFGAIHVGAYSISIDLKNGFKTHISQVYVMPGEDFDMEVTCPIHSDRKQKVSLQFSPPPMKPSGLLPEWSVPDRDSIWLLCRIARSNLVVNKLHWALIPEQLSFNVTLLVNSQGEAYEVDWPDDSGLPVDNAQLRRVREVSGLRDRPWNGVLPAGSYFISGSELLQLLTIDSTTHQASFVLIPPDAVSIAEPKPEDYPPFNFNVSTTPGDDDKPVTWRIPVTGESNDGRMFAPRGPGMGGGAL